MVSLLSILLLCHIHTTFSQFNCGDGDPTCNGVLTCPANQECIVYCGSFNSCESGLKVDATLARSLSFQSHGPYFSTGNIIDCPQSTTGSCDITCLEANACGGLIVNGRSVNTINYHSFGDSQNVKIYCTDTPNCNIYGNNVNTALNGVTIYNDNSFYEVTIICQSVPTCFSANSLTMDCDTSTCNIDPNILTSCTLDSVCNITPSPTTASPTTGTPTTATPTTGTPTHQSIGLIEPLPNNAFSSSSVFDSATIYSYEAYDCKFSSSSGWAPSTVSETPWLRINLEDIYVITKIATKGCGVTSEWVTEYDFFVSLNGISFFYLNTFSGNSDQNTVVEWNVDYIAQYIEFSVTDFSYQTWPSMRVEVYGYLNGSSRAPTTAIPSAFPTKIPSINPTTNNPTTIPSFNPTKIPSFNPTKIPSNNPSGIPTMIPSGVPTTGNDGQQIETTSVTDENGNNQAVEGDEKGLDMMVIIGIGVGMLIIIIIIIILIVLVFVKKNKNKKKTENIVDMDMNRISSISDCNSDNGVINGIEMGMNTNTVISKNDGENEGTDNELLYEGNNCGENQIMQQNVTPQFETAGNVENEEMEQVDGMMNETDEDNGLYEKENNTQGVIENDDNDDLYETRGNVSTTNGVDDNVNNNESELYGRGNTTKK